MFRRNVTCGHLRAGAEEIILHLLGKVFARIDIGQIEPVFIDQHGLELDPALPGFLGDILEKYADPTRRDKAGDPAPPLRDPILRTVLFLP